MSLVTCPDCQHSISEFAPACPHCGRPAAPQPVHTIQQTAKRYKAWQAVGVVVLLVGAFSAVTAAVGDTRHLTAAIITAVVGLAIHTAASLAAWWNHR